MRIIRTPHHVFRAGKTRCSRSNACAIVLETRPDLIVDDLARRAAELRVDEICVGDRDFIHALGQCDQPACTALDECDLRTGVAVKHAAGDKIHHALFGIHHLVGIIDDPRSRTAFDHYGCKTGTGMHDEHDAQFRCFCENRIPSLVIIFW